jgi:hypothetical protein
VAFDESRDGIVDECGLVVEHERAGFGYRGEFEARALA